MIPSNDSIYITITDPYKQPYPGYPPQQGYPSQGYPPQGYAQPGYPQPGPVQPGFMPVPGAVPYGHVPPPPNQHVPYSDNNSSDPIVKGFDFTEQSIRRGFIRKVYSILTVQLAVTLGFIFFFGYHEGARMWAQQHMEMFWVALILMFVTIISLSCCEGVRRTSPHNFIALSLFTLAESYLIAMSTMRFAKDDVCPSENISLDSDVGFIVDSTLNQVEKKLAIYCNIFERFHLRIQHHCLWQYGYGY